MASPSHEPFLLSDPSLRPGRRVPSAWNGGSWLGCGDLPAMGAVFYLGAGWPQWKPLDIPGTHLPLERGSGLNLVKWYLTKLTATSLACVFLGQRSPVLVQAHMVRPSFVSVCLHLCVQAACLCTWAARAAGFFSVLALVVLIKQSLWERQRFVRVFPHPPSLFFFFFLPLIIISVDGCLEWGLMAGLRGFASHGSGILSRGWLATVEAPGYPRHPPSTWARQRVNGMFMIFFAFFWSSSVSSWLIHCSSSVSFFSDSVWLRFEAKELSIVQTRFGCDMFHHA